MKSAKNSALVIPAERRAARTVAARDRLTGQVIVFMNQFHERREGRRKARHVVVRAFTIAPP
jgi:hypothetical protein